MLRLSPTRRGPSSAEQRSARALAAPRTACDAAPVTPLLEHLWADYAAITPQAAKIHAVLAAGGDPVVNDHIALRTLDDPRLGIDALAAPFVAAGWRAAGSYRFPIKKLDARHYDPPDPALPKVFISQLRLAECSPGLQATAARLLDQVPAARFAETQALLGRPWTPEYAEVEALRGESEYAAWFLAHGLRANHFTVLVDRLRRFAGIAELVEFLQAGGFRFNTAGGAIKGSPAQGLEQASTLADSVTVAFADGPAEVPGCYYEFARRHAGPDGARFEGFIEGSADRIFESTDRGPERVAR